MIGTKWRCVAAPLLALAVASACAPRVEEERREAETNAPALAESVGTEILRGEGFTLRYPSGAKLVESPVEPPTRSLVRIAGPEIAIRPADADWRAEGAAYLLDVLTFENPSSLPAEQWVKEHILSQETLSPPRTGSAVVAGEPAVRVESFGGDAQIITLYLARGSRVVGLRYADIPQANQPIAAVQRDVYAMVLSSFRWE